MAARPLFGNPAETAPVFSDYAVVIGGLTAPTPVGPAAYSLNDATADPVVAGAWDPIGALDSDTPFDDGEEAMDSTDHTAAGHGVYETTHKNQRETITFNAKQTDLIKLGILYDATGVTDTGGNLSGVLKRRDPTKRYKVSFHRENATKVERRTSKVFAKIDTLTRNFTNDESTYSVTLLIVGDEDGELWDYYYGAKA